MAVFGLVPRLQITIEGGNNGVYYEGTAIFVRTRCWDQYEAGSDDTLCSDADISDVSVMLYDKNTGTVHYGGAAAYASSYGTQTGQPANNETMIILSKTFTFKDSASGDTEVQIGGSADATYANLVTKVNAFDWGIIASYATPTFTVKSLHYSKSGDTSGTSLAGNRANFSWNATDLASGACGASVGATEDDGALVDTSDIVITSPTSYGAGESEPKIVRVEATTAAGYHSIAEIEIGIIGRSSAITDGA